MAVRIPLPLACKMRANIIRGKLGDSTQSMRPAIKSNNPARYSFRVEKRVIKKAVSGIMMPMASEYPLVSHCPKETSICKSSAMAGSAVVSAVDSMEEAIQLITIFKKIKRRF